MLFCWLAVPKSISFHFFCVCVVWHLSIVCPHMSTNNNVLDIEQLYKTRTNKKNAPHLQHCRFLNLFLPLKKVRNMHAQQLHTIVCCVCVSVLAFVNRQINGARPWRLCARRRVCDVREFAPFVCAWVLKCNLQTFPQPLTVHLITHFSVPLSGGIVHWHTIILIGTVAAKHIEYTPTHRST